MTTNRVPYRLSLRVLGRLLNGDKARTVTVCEIEDGFLLHYFVRGQLNRVAHRAIHSAEVLDLDDMLQKQRGTTLQSESFRDLKRIFSSRQPDALRFQKTHPLCPEGYEEFFRSVGQDLDRRNAHAVLICELERNFHVEYTVDRSDFVLRDGLRVAMPGRRQESHNASQVAEVIRKARLFTAEQVRRSGQHLSFNPMDVVSYLDAAEVLEDYGQYREAESLYRKALDLAPQHSDVLYRLAQLAWRRDDQKSGLKYLEQAIRINGGDSRFFHLLGRIHTQRGRFADAARALEQAQTRDPDNTMYRFHLSQVLERLGRHDEARNLLAPADSQPGAGLVSKVVEEMWGPDEFDTADSRTIAAPDTRASGIPELPPYTGPGDRNRQEDSGNDHQMAEAIAPSNAQPTTTTPESEGSRSGISPFSLEKPAWETLPGLMQPAQTAWTPPSAPDGKEPNGDQAGGSDESPSSVQSVPAVHEDSAELLPVLGLSLSNEWAKQTLPTLDVPTDSWAAAAALPMSGAIMAQAAAAPSAPSDSARSDARATRGSTESAGVPASDEAVQLAAAILRAEELMHAEPHRADLHRKLGFLLAKAGRSEEAAAEFRRAVECGRRRIAG